MGKKEVLVSTFKELGIPLEPSKLIGPAQVMEFLGIEVDTLAMQLRLPPEKLERLASLVSDTAGKNLLL